MHFNIILPLCVKVPTKRRGTFKGRAMAQVLVVGLSQRSAIFDARSVRAEFGLGEGSR